MVYEEEWKFWLVMRLFTKKIPFEIFFFFGWLLVAAQVSASPKKNWAEPQNSFSENKKDPFHRRKPC